MPLTFRLIMRFDNEPDPHHPFMYHCHLLWHEDQGMMGQFVVVEPGQSVGTLSSDQAIGGGTGESSKEGVGHDHR